MAVSDLVLLEADHTRFTSVLDRVRKDANAKVVFLIDKNGQQLAHSGDVSGLDPTSLASLTAGNVAATDGLAKLLGEREFSILFHEGEHDNLHISIVAGKAILVVLFDNAGNRSWASMRRVLTPDGTVILVGGPRRRRLLGPLGHIARIKLASALGGRTSVFFVAKPNRDDLATLRDLIEAGHVKPVIERRYDLAQLPEAIRTMGEGHARAKIVVTM
jgi:threonine dehydrogenase-like Zn-dependent dehydrogenase